MKNNFTLRYTASKVINDGSKIRVNPFSAKLSPAFENERKRSWGASSSLVLVGTFFAPFFDLKTPAKS